MFKTIIKIITLLLNGGLLIAVISNFDPIGYDYKGILLFSVIVITLISNILIISFLEDSKENS